jgi:hypothetical protein
MPEELTVQPEITATLEHRKASSSCHGALLDPGLQPGTYACQECGQPCERRLGEPVTVTASGGLTSG